MNYQYSPTRNVTSIAIKAVIIAVAFAASLIGGITAYSTYSVPNDPQAEFVSGTLYITGERGQTIIRVNDRYGNPVANAACKTTIIYPDKAIFVTDATMNQSSVAGNYYYEFISPERTGLYEEIVKCRAVNNLGEELNLTASSSFQVSEAVTRIENLTEIQVSLIINLTQRLDNAISALNSTVNSKFNETNARLNSLESNISKKVDKKTEEIYRNMYNATQAMSLVYLQAANQSG